MLYNLIYCFYQKYAQYITIFYSNYYIKSNKLVQASSNSTFSSDNFKSTFKLEVLKNFLI